MSEIQSADFDKPSKGGFELSPRGRRALLTLHLLLVALATGSSAALLVMLSSERLMLQGRALVGLLDRMLTPASLGFLFTGLAFGLLTRWGFVRTPWVAAKWAATIVLAILIPAFLAPAIATVAARVDVGGARAINGPDARSALRSATIYSALSTATFVSLIALSVFKPGRAPVRESRPASRRMQWFGGAVAVIVLAAVAAQTSTVLGGRELAVARVAPSSIPDGEYTGETRLSGFTYRTLVLVRRGRIADIRFLQNRSSHYAHLAEGVAARVRAHQSTCVDVVSGASTTSRALLATIGDALNRSQRDRALVSSVRWCEAQ
jgi:uncharacterized protein with FMN-binding domain